MDYEKAYKEAIKRAKAIIEVAEKEEEVYKSAITIFPELRESEDERIRKVLIDYFNRYKEQEECGIKTFFGIPTDNILAWLEKKKNIDVLDKEEREFAYNVDSYRKEIDEFYKGYNVGKEAEKQYWLKKQSEQKSVSKEYTFKSIPRLLDMIEPTDRAKSYCKKLIDSLQTEGYSVDAKIVGECLKQMNGEKVAMAVMDNEKQDEKKSQRMISAEAKEALYDKPTDEEMKELLRTEYEKGRADTIAEMKSSWSEEDEKQLMKAIWYVDNPAPLVLKDTMLIEWLKQLKQRIGG